MKALHIHEYNRARQANSSGDISGIPHHSHPIFITHPDTRRKTLFVDRLMTTRIEGTSEDDSNAILDQLYEIGERREFIFEHVWELGDFLMWDNRCTIHARTDSRRGSGVCCAAAPWKASRCMRIWRHKPSGSAARRHCEERSDEAIQPCAAFLDCFASLAMTTGGAVLWSLTVASDMLRGSSCRTNDFPCSTNSSATCARYGLRSPTFSAEWRRRGRRWRIS